jgi:hypothetical protein
MEETQPNRQTDGQSLMNCALDRAKTNQVKKNNEDNTKRTTGSENRVHALMRARAHKSVHVSFHMRVGESVHNGLNQTNTSFASFDQLSP